MPAGVRRLLERAISLDATYTGYCSSAACSGEYYTGTDEESRETEIMRGSMDNKS